MKIILFKMNYGLILQAFQRYVSLDLFYLFLPLQCPVDGGWGATCLQPAFWLTPQEMGRWKEEVTGSLRHLLPHSYYHITTSYVHSHWAVFFPRLLYALRVVLGSGSCLSTGSPYFLVLPLSLPLFPLQRKSHQFSSESHRLVPFT